MNSLKDRKDEIVNFYDFENESDKTELIEDILKYSEMKSENEFVAEIRENFKQIPFSGIGVIYEALSKNPLKWSNFLKEEYERAFELAKKSENAFEILDSLEEISIGDEDNVECRDEIIGLLASHLSNKNDSIRYMAIWFLGDWIPINDQDKYSNVVDEIITKLYDDNWKIRNCANIVLQGFNKLPKNYKISLWDKLKIRFGNPYKF